MTTMTTTTTKHKDDCARVFSRYDMTCDRCVELRMGFGARQGWGLHGPASRRVVSQPRP